MRNYLLAAVAAATLATPAVAREWAAENTASAAQTRAPLDPDTLLQDPRRNIQIACWYLQKAGEEYRDLPGREARMLAAYNAGPSRAADCLGYFIVDHLQRCSWVERWNPNCSEERQPKAKTHSPQ